MGLREIQLSKKYVVYGIDSVLDPRASKCAFYVSSKEDVNQNTVKQSRCSSRRRSQWNVSPTKHIRIDLLLCGASKHFCDRSLGVFLFHVLTLTTLQKMYKPWRLKG